MQMEVFPEIVKKKNKWLASQVDVKFPTLESLKGRDLYLKYEKQSEYTRFSADLTVESKPVAEEIYLVNFHRLTVMFSIIQASRWSDEKERAYVLEFFSQIILNDTCQLYVGFADTVPVGCAIVTQNEDNVLISDVMVTDVSSDQDGEKSMAGDSEADNKSTASRFQIQLINHLNLSCVEKELWVKVNNLES